MRHTPGRDALSKPVRIREDPDFTIRFDAVHAPNTPQWGDPNLNIQSSSFGRITGAGRAHIDHERFPKFETDSRRFER